MSKPASLAVTIAALLAQPAFAQPPANALAAQWNGICATAIQGTLLFLRCDETLNSNHPEANLIAAIGQRLGEIPGQGRVATRDVSPALASVNVDVGGRNLSFQPGAINDGGAVNRRRDRRRPVHAMVTVRFHRLRPHPAQGGPE